MSGTAAPRRGTETRQRRRVVAVRCTDAELAAIAAGAARAGLTVGAFMRRQATGQVQPRAARRPPVEIAALARALAVLGQSRLASNLNQLAHAANSGEIPAAVELTAAAAAVLEMRDALMAALRRGH